MTNLSDNLTSRQTNRHTDGRIKNLALDMRLQSEERRIVIEALGMKPEDPGDPGDRYAASTDQMIKWLREDGKL